MEMKTLDEIDVRMANVLMRVDFNVPVENGKVVNDKRIREALPSIKYALKKGGKLILMSHRGRPSGTGYEAEFSNQPIADYLSKLLHKKVLLGSQDVGSNADIEAAWSLRPGEILLLENLRFNRAENLIDKAEKSPLGKPTTAQRKIIQEFAKRLALLGDIYVNDAFGTCHRKHASMYNVPKLMIERGGYAVAGFLVRKEVEHLDMLLNKPEHPFIAILGGAKVSDKIRLIDHLSSKVNCFLIGGAMAYTLIKALGVRIGKSRVEDDQVEEMRKLLDSPIGKKIILPIDHICSDRFDPKEKTAGDPILIDGMAIPNNFFGMDIGPKTIAAFNDLITLAETIIWNGPLGYFESPEYAEGTTRVAKAIISAATKRGIMSVIGGGDTIASIELLCSEQLDDKQILEPKTPMPNNLFLSTGGGAFLEYLEGGMMPPLRVLEKK